MTPRKPDELFIEIHQLVTAQLREGLTAEQQARLESLVLHEPEARKLYVAYMQDTAALDRWASCRAHRSTTGSADGRQRPSGRPHVLPRVTWRRAALAAAAVLLAVGLAFWLTPGRPAATLLAAVDGVWEHQGQAASLRPGDGLTRGRWRLVSGMAEVAFAGGARVVVESPVEMQVENGGTLRLHEGQLVAHVTGPAAGFTVLTADASIVDRGTEFGVRARRGAPAEVHVFTGLVEAELASSRQPVKQGAAARLDAAARAISPVPLDPTGFIRHLPTAGLLGEYFDDISLQNRVATRIDPVLDFTDPSWDLAPPGTEVTPDGHYSIRWTGFVKIDRPGDWRFFTISNDGVRLWVNGKLLIDNWMQHKDLEDSKSTALPAGWHALRVEYYQQDLNVALRLSFAGPGTTRRIIPASHLSAVHPWTGEKAAPLSGL